MENCICPENHSRLMTEIFRHLFPFKDVEFPQNLYSWQRKRSFKFPMNFIVQSLKSSGDELSTRNKKKKFKEIVFLLFYFDCEIFLWGLLLWSDNVM
jgi:hypothetical protein